MGGAAVAVGATPPGGKAEWSIIAGATLGSRAAPVPVDLVALHPRLGVALIEFGTDDGRDTVALFQSRLAQAGFSARYPGTLPVIPLRLHDANLGALMPLLAKAFADQPPVGITGQAWLAALQRLLHDLPEELPPAPAAAIAAASLGGPAGRGRYVVLIGVALIGLAVAAAALFSRRPPPADLPRDTARQPVLSQRRRRNPRPPPRRPWN